MNVPNPSFNSDAASASHFHRHALRFLVSPQRATSVDDRPGCASDRFINERCLVHSRRRNDQRREFVSGLNAYEKGSRICIQVRQCRLHCVVEEQAGFDLGDFGAGGEGVQGQVPKVGAVADGNVD